MRFAVVGHVEWVEFAVVERYPPAGTIAFASGPPFTDAGGGGAVAAVELHRLAGTDAAFLTSVGEDELGRATLAALRGHGVRTHAAVHPLPQRRAFTHLDGTGERTITVLGERHIPLGADDLPWPQLAECDAVYFAGGDAGALRAARAARWLVATPRAWDVLAEAGVALDVLVLSADDPDEAVAPGVDARTVVVTEGDRGGSWTSADGSSGRWDATPLPGERVDAYGCGDTFAAALTYGLGTGLPLDEALHLGAQSGAACLCRRGPNGRQP